MFYLILLNFFLRFNKIKYGIVKSGYKPNYNRIK